MHCDVRLSFQIDIRRRKKRIFYRSFNCFVVFAINIVITNHVTFLLSAILDRNAVGGSFELIRGIEFHINSLFLAEHTREEFRSTVSRTIQLSILAWIR